MNRHSHDGGRTWHRHDPGDGLLWHEHDAGAGAPPQVAADPDPGEYKLQAVPCDGCAARAATPAPVAGGFDPADDVPSHGTYWPDGRWRPEAPTREQVLSDLERWAAIYRETTGDEVSPESLRRAEALGASSVIPLGGDPPHRMPMLVTSWPEPTTCTVEWYGVSFAGIDPVLWPEPMTALPVDDSAWFEPPR